MKHLIAILMIISLVLTNVYSILHMEMVQGIVDSLSGKKTRLDDDPRFKSTQKHKDIDTTRARRR